MSFDFPQQSSRKKKGGMSGIAMLILVGAVLFFFMQNQGGTQGNSQSGDDRGAGYGRSETRPEFDYDLDPDFGKNQRPDTPAKRVGDGSEWSLEDVATNNRKSKKKASSNDTRKISAKDGWSLEDVPSKKSGAGVELNDASRQTKVEIPDKKNSDWSLEEIDVDGKKTKEGDWSLEEVGGAKRK